MLDQPVADAQPVADDGAMLLFSAMAPSIAQKIPAEQQVPQNWCRDPLAIQGGGLYRPGGAKDRYFVAFEDAGRGISVTPDTLGAIISKEKGKEELSYAVQFIDMSRALGFGNFKTLPGVAQAVRLVMNGKAKFSTTTWGKNTSVNIDGASFK